MFYVVVPIVLFLIVLGILWVIFSLIRHFFMVDRYSGLKLLCCGLATVLIPAILLQLHCSVYGDDLGPFLNFDGVIDSNESEAWKALMMLGVLMLLVVYFTWIKVAK